MTLHLFILCWVILSHCSTGDSRQQSYQKLGDRCTGKCGGINLVCNMTVRECQCHKDFPIVANTNLKTLCLQPAKLYEDCLHDDACLATDRNSGCIQKDHAATCRCVEHFHEVFDKNTHRCVLETQLLSSDLATLLGVGAGMTLFCGLTCLILRLFARARFGPRRHHYANAHLAPPITLSTDHDPERGMSASRHSSQRSSQGGSRRPSTLLAPPSSRPDGGGSRRASSTSIRSTASARSFSLKAHSNHHSYHHHRPSDPETHSSLNMNSLNIAHHPQPKSDTNLARSSAPGQSIIQPSPRKAKRSGSAGAI